MRYDVRADVSIQLETTSTETITVSDGAHHHTHKKGFVFIENKVSKGNRKILKFDIVLLDPELDTNLDSFSNLETEGYTNVFQIGRCYIIKNDDVMCRAEMEDWLYVLIAPQFQSAHMGKARTEAEELWHMQFGHVYLRTLKDAARRGTVFGMYFK